MKNISTTIFFLTIAALLTVPTRAAFVLLDNMDYGVSDQGSGVGDWVDGSNRLNYIGAENMTFAGDADYVNDPANAGTGSLERNANIDDRFFTRDYTDAGLTGEFWMSAVINVNGSGGDNAGEIVGISLNSTGGLALTGDLLGIGFDGTNLRPGWRDQSTGTTAYDLGRTVTASSTVLLLAKLNVGAGDDSFSMWLFDNADSFDITEASLGAAHLSSITADFGSALDHIQVGGVEGFESNFDQIRISDLSGDNGLSEVLTLTVPIPEPSTAILAGLGMAGLCIRRRRR